MKSSKVVWYRYVPFTDDSIEIIDKVLWVVYIVMAFLMPISAVFSLVIINKLRKDAVHSTYRKAANFAVVFIAVLGFLGGIFHSCDKQAMPLTQSNISKWNSLMLETSKNISRNTPLSAPSKENCGKSVEIYKKILKDTCEELGYDFDKTIISIAKVGKLNESAFSNPYFAELYNNVLSVIYALIDMCPNEVVDEGLLKQDTVKALISLEKATK